MERSERYTDPFLRLNKREVVDWKRRARKLSGKKVQWMESRYGAFRFTFDTEGLPLSCAMATSRSLFEGDGNRAIVQETSVGRIFERSVCRRKK